MQIKILHVFRALIFHKNSLKQIKPQRESADNQVNASILKITADSQIYFWKVTDMDFIKISESVVKPTLEFVWANNEIVCWNLKPMSSNSMLLFIFEKKAMYKIIARLNKMVLPSFTKQNLNLAKAKKWQLALIGYRYFITCRALE